mmetsp:Transcript_3462/g.5013  ORF Transcript_3462/g.5013 Transcript_3462/m.5013 type:complete len:204 (+) Transcript_3462:3818-4429(+)
MQTLPNVSGVSLFKPRVSARITSYHLCADQTTHAMKLFTVNPQTIRNSMCGDAKRTFTLTRTDAPIRSGTILLSQVCIWALPYTWVTKHTSYPRLTVDASLLLRTISRLTRLSSRGAIETQTTPSRSRPEAPRRAINRRSSSTVRYLPMLRISVQSGRSVFEPDQCLLPSSILRYRLHSRRSVMMTTLTIMTLNSPLTIKASI